MKEQQEKLSALLDDYQANKEDQDALSDLLADVNQRYTLQRYTLIGDVLRNEVPDKIRTDFAAEVMSQIEQEPSLKIAEQKVDAPAPASSSSGFWSWMFKPVAGMAVAAAVAVVTISTLQLQPDSSNQSNELASATDSSAKVEQLAQTPVLNLNTSPAVRVSSNPVSQQLSDGMNWKVKRNQPATQAKLNSYLINHNEYSKSMSGIIPQARVVGFDGQK